MRTHYLHHVTLTTGDVTRTTRADVSDEALEVCAELLREALAGSRVPIPGVGHGFALAARVHGGRCVLAQVLADGVPVVTFGVAAHSRCGASLWSDLHSDGALPAATAGRPCHPEPWCAVRLERGAATPRGMQAMAWVGDFERCLAWAALSPI